VDLGRRIASMLPKFSARPAALGLATLGALALAANGALAVVNVRRMAEAEAWVSRAHDVREALDGVLTSLEDAETGQRGFLLTGAPAYLQPWEAANAALGGKLAALEALTRDEPDQRARVEAMRPLIDERLAELTSTIALRRQPGGFEAARRVVLSDLGKHLMDDLRERIEAMSAAQHRLMEARVEASREASRRTVFVHLASLAVGFCSIGAALVLGRARERERARAERFLRRYELVANHSRDIVLFMRRDGRILEANQAAAASYGYSLDELRALTIRDLRAPETQGLTAEQMAQADESGLLFESLHRRRDGTTFPVEVSSQGATVDGERTLVSVVRDVTERRRAGEALRRREAQLQGIVEGLSEGLIVSTMDGDLIHWNRAALDMHGFATVEEVRRRLVDFEGIYSLATLEGRELPVAEWPLARLLRGEPVREVELAVRRRAEERSRIFSYGGSVVTGPEGRPLAVLTVTDVTERRRAAEQLAAEAERLAVTLRSIGDAVIATDAAARVTILNRVAEELTGWRAEEALGRPVHEVFRIVSEETRRPAESPVERAMREGVIVGLANHTALVARDGSERPIADSAAPIRDAAGRVAGVVLVFRDQTEERRAERVLRESEAGLRLLAEALPQLVWTASGDGRVDSFNARWREYTGQPAGAEAWEPVLHPDDREQAVALWRDAVARQREFEVEHRLRRADGEYRWFLRRAILLRDGEGPGGRWFGTCTDIHDLKVSQEVLRQADRLKEDFLSIASHEFRTPLTALRLQAGLLARALRRAQVSDEGVDRQLSLIDGQLDRLQGLIGLLLDVTRINEGRLSLDLASVDLAEVAREVVERFRAEAEAAGTELHLRGRGVQGRWDRLRLDQVVTNLVGNAIKYGNRRPVEVEVEGRDGAAVLVVRDRGIGIPPEGQARIFERFERGANAGGIKGLGLGLWIARKLVEAHGGEITVQSALGAGSTFVVSLPGVPGE